MKKIKILLVAGDLNPDYSYEIHNFLQPLRNIGCEVFTFDFIKILQETSRHKMNSELLAIIKSKCPNLVIFVPQTDEFLPEIITEIGKYSSTLAYYFDDVWRIQYSLHWANYFKYVTTSELTGLDKYIKAGLSNAIYSPFACNVAFYKKIKCKKIYDVTFIGGYNPYREWYINYLKRKGIDIHVWGNGWGNGPLNSKEMVEIFNQSRINLNLSNNISWNLKYLFSLNRTVRKTLHIWKSLLFSIFENDKKNIEMVKGRHFEINACGSFQLSHNVKDLNNLYTIGEEIVVFNSPKELEQKIRYFLENEKERELIAYKGYLRTKKDHIMEKRFMDILRQIPELNKPQ